MREFHVSFEFFDLSSKKLMKGGFVFFLLLVLGSPVLAAEPRIIEIPKDPKPEDFQYWARDQAECNFEVSSGICVEMHWLDTPELKKDLAFELRVVDRDGQPVELRKLPEISFSKFESRETGSPVEIKPHLDQNGEPLLGEYLVERVYFYSEGFWLIQVALALEYNWISAQFAFPLVVMKREEGPFFKFN